MTSFSSEKSPQSSPSIIPDANSSVSSHFVMGETMYSYEVSEMSDEELQAHIQLCAREFLAAQARWDETGEFSAIGDRDRWWAHEAEALRERGSRPHLVQGMEQELGL